MTTAGSSTSVAPAALGQDDSSLSWIRAFPGPQMLGTGGTLIVLAFPGPQMRGTPGQPDRAEDTSVALV